MVRTALVLLSCCLLAACGGQLVSAGTVRADLVPATALELVDVELRTGAIELVAGGESVHIDAEVFTTQQNAAAFDPGAFAEHVTIAQDGATLRVRSSHDVATDRNDWSLHLRIEVPGAPALATAVNAGKIAIDVAAAGAVTALVDAGQIRIAAGRVDGKVEANVSAGQIELAAGESTPAGGVALSVGAGEIDLALPRDAPGEYRLRSSTGNVTIGDGWHLEATREGVGALAEGRIGEGGPRVEATVDVGRVALR